MIRKARPQRHINGCTHCDGLGAWTDEDFDEHGRHVVIERCDACDGTGLVSDCIECGEATALSVLEQLSGRCGQCAAERELAS